VNPYLELVYESGVCGAHPEALAEGIADSVLVSGAESVVNLQALFGYVLQGGNVDVGFLGAAQVDREGRQADTGEHPSLARELPGRHRGEELGTRHGHGGVRLTGGYDAHANLRP
jgi:hypothetical protein